MKSVPLKDALWEMHNGPIPPGHHVKQVHDSNDFRMSNLMLAQGAEPKSAEPAPVIEVED